MKSSPSSAPAALGVGSTSSCWWGSDTAADTFLVGFLPQRLGDKLDVRLDFYKSVPRASLDPAIRRAMARAEEIVRIKKGIDLPALNTIFREEVHAELRAAGAGNAVVVIRPVSEGHCIISDGLPDVSLSARHEAAIREVVINRSVIENSGASLDSIEGRLRNLDANSAFARLIVSLRQIAASKAPLGLAPADVDALAEAVNSSSAPAQPVTRRLASVVRECGRGGDEGRVTGCDLLRQTVELFNSHHRLTGALQQQTASVAAAEGNIGVEVKNAFNSVAVALIPGVAWEDAPATSERLRFGTALGVGASLLGRDFNSQDLATFGAASLKFYFYPIDKRLPDPYFGRAIRGRSSLVIGAVRGGGIRYRGQEQEKITGSLFPLLGLGLDATRDITAQVGMLFFRQPVPAGVAGPVRSSVEGAPFLSLGLDLDLGNRISDVLGNALK